MSEQASNETPETDWLDPHNRLAPSAVVGIGASAGGLEALETLFDSMPAETGLTFVVVQHLSPDFKSLMDELLSRHTKIRIFRVTDGMSVESNAIYLIPPKKEMVISGGRLLLTDKDPARTNVADRYLPEVAGSGCWQACHCDYPLRYRK